MAADYVPIYEEADQLTQLAGATITAGQLLAVTGVKTVTPTAGATAAWLGVAATDVATGARVTVHCGGVQNLVASGAITAGDQVIPAAAGAVASLAAVTTPTAGDVTGTRQIVGIALTTAADTEKVWVKLAR